MPQLDTYDPEADQNRAPVEDGQHDNLGTHPERREAETDDLENQFNQKSIGKKKRNNKKPDNRPEQGERVFGSGKLKSDEENPAYGPSAGDDIDGRLNKGYTKGSGRKTFTSRMWNKKGDSKLKKRIAIAGAAAGGSLIGGILLFLLMLPLKIEHLITNAQGKFAAASVNAIGHETDALFSAWVAKNIIPNLGKGTCHSTIDITCVSTSNGNPNNPVTKLFAGWKDSRLEQKLATKYNIVLGSDNGKLFINFPGASLSVSDADLARLRTGELSLFEIGESDRVHVNRSQFRDAYKRAMKDATLWDRAYFRYKVGRLAERKYGVKRCVIACNARDKFTDSVANKKFAAKAVITRRVIGTFSDSAGLLTQCIIAGADCRPDLDEAHAGEEERRSPAQKKLNAELVKYAEKFGADKLESLVKKSEEINKNGFTKVVAKDIATKVASAVGGDAAGAVAGAAAEKLVPVVGWIIFASTVISTAHELGPMVRTINYAASSAAAVQSYHTLATAVSEYKSNHMDLTEFGSFVTALSTNLDGSTKDRVDYTKTPLYKDYFGGSQPSNVSSILSSILPGTAFADTVTPGTETSDYTCNDGSKPDVAVTPVCPEEQFARGNDVANQISNVIDHIPVLPQVAGVVSSIGAWVGEGVGAVFTTACNLVPGCNAAVTAIGGFIGEFITWLTSGLIVSPISEHMSGGRQGDLAIAGPDALQNSSCQIQLGCTTATKEAMAKEQTEYANEQKRDFMSQSFFARMFDTSSSYSLIGHLADAMPTTLTETAADGVGSLLDNPFGKFAGVFASAFSVGHASAATVQPMADPFGIPQMYMPAADIPQHPDEYWDAHCQGTWHEDWLNSQVLDEASGTAIPTKSEPCLLIQAAIASAGATSDSSLATLGDPDPPAATPPPSGAGGAGYGATAEQLADLPAACKDGTASGSVRMLCVGAKYRNLVPYLLAHPYTGKTFSERWAKGERDGLTLDCSLFVGTALWDAYGVDNTSSSDGYVGLTALFQKIDIAQAQPGDLAVADGHIAIVNVPNTSVLDANSKHSGSPVDDVNIHPWSYSNFQYALRYIGPNAAGTSVKVGGGTAGGSTADQNGQGIQLDGLSDLITGNQFPNDTTIIPKVTNVVIHWLTSNPETPADVANALTSNGGTSVEFYVSQSGKMMQLTEFANSQAGHAKDSNKYAVGIEIGSPNGAGDSPPYNSIQTALQNNAVQKAQVIKLATAIAKKFGITNITVDNKTLFTGHCTTAAFASALCATQQEASAFGIVGHYQLQNDKSDPGKANILEIQTAVKANLGL